MKSELFLAFILLAFSLLLYYYYFLQHKNMIYVKSDIDNNFYLVRDVPDKQQAANILGKISQNVESLSNYLYGIKNDEKCKDYVNYINILHNKYKSIIYLESDQDSMYTSYSINKGEQIVFCLRTKQSTNELHNINLIMYVVLHEISHVACPIYDNHGPLFQKIFAFITQNAIDTNLYTKIDFAKNPVDYCGLNINKSII